MPSPQPSLAILFADVCDSTAMYDVLGDAAARQIVARCIELMRADSERAGGRVVKTIGDEIMAVFGDADAAAGAARDMQEHVAREPFAGAYTAHIRAGLHFGEVLTEPDGDVYGDAVNVAARLAGQAKRGQILTSAATAQRLDASWQGALRSVERVALHGRQDAIEVIEILWQREELTQMATHRSLHPTPAARTSLHLRYRGLELEVNETKPSVVMGRADDNDLVVQNARASRLHARVEYRKGHFVLVDQSINGTYLMSADGREQFVRRDNYPLQDTGILALGERLAPDAPDAIVFRCVRE